MPKKKGKKIQATVNLPIFKNPKSNSQVQKGKHNGSKALRALEINIICTSCLKECWNLAIPFPLLVGTHTLYWKPLPAIT